MARQGWWGFCFTLPFVINLLVFFLFPFVFSLYLTFTRWDLFNPPEWIGLTNWIYLLTEGSFWISMRNIAFFALIFIPLQTFFALLVAHLLNQQIRAKSLFRAIYYLPAITPWMAAGIAWLWLYNNQYGVINWILSSLNVGTVNWLGDPRWWIVIGAVALANVWKGIGSSMVLLLAGMQNISSEMLEAARIDGATGRTLFFRIVMPLTSPMIYLVMILSSISAFQAFDVFLIMLGVDSVPDRYNIPNLIIYQDAFLNYRMARASTVAWILFIAIMALTLFQRTMEKRWVHYD